ncbi:MAG: type II toxin-antitoxin system RelE/ParE family toxin [Balneolaceae bacterium]|nr:type II toxin-antitoxin system RelE/ParE family toxin [Balneolaceae bacterium]
MGRLRSDLKKGYMSFLYEHHIIFFKKKTNHIEVIRVLHQRMDVSKRLM